MSITAPTNSPRESPDRQPHSGFDAWVLCAEFVEKILAEARLRAIQEHPDRPAPEFDRGRIWRAGDAAPSDEAAIGRILRAAWEATQGAGDVVGVADEMSGSAPAEIAAAEPTAPSEPLVRPHPPIEPAVPIAPELVSDALEQSPPDAGRLRAEERRAEETDRAASMGPLAATDLVGRPSAPRHDDSGTSTPGEPDAPAANPAGATHTGAAHTTEPMGTDTLVVPTVRPDEWVPAQDAVPASADVASETLARAARKNSTWVTFFTWMRNIGAVILLFVAWQLWGTAIAQHHAQSDLQQQFESSVKAHHAPANAKPALVSASTFVPAGGNGSVVARLQIPAIGVDQYVVEGTSEDDLAKGPGHYVGTAMPGQAGNIAIAGHRTTHGAPFNRLGKLVPGDHIILTTTSGQSWTYLVSANPVAVSPRDVGVLNYFGDNRITLTTCNPEYSATQRLIAVGLLKGDTSVGTEAAHLRYHVVNSGTSSWDWALLPAVGLIVSLLVLLGLSFRRFRPWFGSVGMWLVLVPLWSAGLYLLFSTLVKFLPSAY